MPQTGPKTPRGKAVSSRNAEKHGILSNTPVLDIEDPADWDAHLQGTLDSLEPEGYLETVLVLRVATRYEAFLHHQWLQTQHELEAMQTRRRGGTSPLARLDIIGPPSG